MAPSQAKKQKHNHNVNSAVHLFSSSSAFYLAALASVIFSVLQKDTH